MKKRLFLLFLPVITLILELLPYGAVLNFANPEGKPWRRTFSYFSLIPFGYANFAPLFTAVLTCIIILLLIIYCITGKPALAVCAKNILCVCSVISLGPILFGLQFLSVVGVMITVCLIAEFLILHFGIHKSMPDSNE